MPRVLVFGTFDGLHQGHRFFLDEAAKHGELFVVVALDATVERIKGKSSRQTQQERIEAIQSAYPDAQVSPGNMEDYLAPVRDIEPDIICLGYDQQFPPGVSEEDLPCSARRLTSHEPEKFKSSLL